MDNNLKINQSFESNDLYKFNQSYNKIYNYQFIKSNIYGKIMIFKGIDKNKSWKDLVYLANYLSTKYSMNFKFNKAVICIYTLANDFENIIALFKELKELYLNNTFYFKLDYQTISNKQYNNKNYIYSSNNIDNINQSYLNKVIDFYNLNNIILPIKS